jgi:hypothetical protein
MHHQPSSSATAQAWRAITIFAIVPSVIYVLLLALAFIGITEPFFWLANDIFDGPWAIPCFWFCTIGGPLFTIIMGLTLEAWHERTPLVARVSGGFAWMLLVISCFSSLPAAFLLAMD